MASRLKIRLHCCHFLAKTLLRPTDELPSTVDKTLMTIKAEPTASESSVAYVDQAQLSFPSIYWSLVCLLLASQALPSVMSFMSFYKPFRSAQFSR